MEKCVLVGRCKGYLPLRGTSTPDMSGEANDNYVTINWLIAALFA